MVRRLTGKASLITGAGSGIGRAMAVLFAREGAQVLAADRTRDAAEETVRLIRDVGGTAEAMQTDVSRSEEVQAMIAACLESFGRIDVLCNNAGIGSTQTVVDTSEELWSRVFDVNVFGTFLGCKYAIPHMIEQGGGVIVNTASVAGLVGIRNRAAYCASKGAVVLLTKSVALDYVNENIRCNCVCPGTVGSPWVERLLANAADPDAERAVLEARQPMGRLGTPEEIAEAALYLASDAATFVTGTELIIDGGWTAA